MAPELMLLLVFVAGLGMGFGLCALAFQMGWRVANYQAPIPPVVTPKSEPEPVEQEEKQVVPFMGDPNA